MAMKNKMIDQGINYLLVGSIEAILMNAKFNVCDGYTDYLEVLERSGKALKVLVDEYGTSKSEVLDCLELIKEITESQNDHDVLLDKVFTYIETLMPIEDNVIMEDIYTLLQKIVIEHVGEEDANSSELFSRLDKLSVTCKVYTMYTLKGFETLLKDVEDGKLSKAQNNKLKSAIKDNKEYLSNVTSILSDSLDTTKEMGIIDKKDIQSLEKELIVSKSIIKKADTILANL